MEERFFEVLAVLAYSTRTQVAIVLGVVFFFAIQVLGLYALDNFHLTGTVSSLTDVIKEKFAHGYDKVAWVTLIGFWWLAIKLYRQDKRKFRDSFR